MQIYKLQEEVGKINNGDLSVGNYVAVRYNDPAAVQAYNEINNSYCKDGTNVYKGIDNKGKICFYNKNTDKVWYIVKSKTKENLFSIINDRHDSFSYNDVATKEFAQKIQQPQQETQPIQQQVKNINTQIYNSIKDVNIKALVGASGDTAIQSIKLDSNNNRIIVEKLNKEKSIVESLNIELPNFISDRLTEAHAFNINPGTVNINNIFNDDVANVLNATNTNIIELRNNNGTLEFIKDDGQIANIEELKSQYQQSEQDKQNQANAEAMNPKITKEDLNKLIQTLINEINKNKQIKHEVTSTLGDNVSFQVSFTGETGGLKESAIKQFNEGIFTGMANGLKKGWTGIKNDWNTAKQTMNTIENNDVQTQNATFSLNIKLNGINIDEKNQEQVKEVITNVQNEICKVFSGKSFKDANGKRITFNLNPTNDKIENNGNTYEISFETNMIKKPVNQNTQSEQNVQNTETQNLNQQPVQNNNVQAQAPVTASQNASSNRLNKQMQRAQIKNLNAQTKLLKSQAKANTTLAKRCGNNYYRNSNNAWNNLRAGFTQQSNHSGRINQM